MSMTPPDPRFHISHITLVNQHGAPITETVEVRQDGNPPAAVMPHQRTRFKVRTPDLGYLGYQLDQLFIEDEDNWHICDIRVGGQSQLPAVSTPDRVNDDGVPAGILSACTNTVRALYAQIAPVQIGMSLALDVIYRGTQDVAFFICKIHCTPSQSNTGEEVRDEQPN